MALRADTPEAFLPKRGVTTWAATGEASIWADMIATQVIAMQSDSARLTGSALRKNLAKDQIMFETRLLAHTQFQNLAIAILPPSAVTTCVFTKETFREKFILAGALFRDRGGKGPLGATRFTMYLRFSF